MLPAIGTAAGEVGIMEVAVVAVAEAAPDSIGS